MTLTVTNVGDNQFAPGVAAVSYIPDQLIAGNLKLITDTVTLAAGTLPRGAILGQVTASQAYILSVKTAVDGSQIPSAVLADAADASGGPVQAPAYLIGEFNLNAVTFDASWTAGTLKAALRAETIFLKNVVSAADPT